MMKHAEQVASTRSSTLRCIVLCFFSVLVATACGGTTTEPSTDATTGDGASSTSGVSDGSGGSETEADGTGGRSDSASSGASMEPPLCFDPDETVSCADPTGNVSAMNFPVLLSLAEEIVPSAQFTQLGGLAALLEIPNEEGALRYRVVSALSPTLYAYESFETQRLIVATLSWPEAVGDWEVRDLWAEVNEAPLVLACDEVRCVILSASGAMGEAYIPGREPAVSERTAELTPIAGVEFPLSAQAQHIAMGYMTYCVYGASLYCAGGYIMSAQEPFEFILPSEFGTRFESIVDPYFDGDSYSFLAVTDTGALLNWRAGDWELLLPPGDPITSIANYGGLITTLHQSGTWRSSGALDQECTQHTSLVGTGLFYYSPYYGAMAVTREGELFRRWQRQDNQPGGPTEWCQANPKGSLWPNSIIETSYLICGLSNMSAAITRHEFVLLFGPIGCAIG